MNLRILISFIQLLLLSVTPFGKISYAQISGVVNQYIDVTAIDYTCNKVTVSNSAAYTAGDFVLLIQMKGATINATTTSAAFGSVTSINDAGNYEFHRIYSISGNDIYFTNTILNTYTITGLVQLVRVPEYTNVSVTGTLTGNTWNGLTGGIIAIKASGTVTLNANINANGIGFRGGDFSLDNDNCNFITTTYASANTSQVSQKGEGIYNIPANQNFGLAKITNGGGGGSYHNAGGGGGSNWGSGGSGGRQSSGCSVNTTIAQGGVTLNPYVSNSRIFLGGGGGGGHQNDAVGTAGSNGGGIIFIIANDIVGNNFTISSNGLDATNAGGDGGGGAGGAGSIMISVNTISNTIIQSNGGTGADTNSPNRNLGPGGGGGGGLIYLSTATTPGGVTTSVNGGAAGFSTNAADATLNGNRLATAGAAGTVLYNYVPPQSTATNSCALPLTLLDFGIRTATEVFWITALESDIKAYIIKGSIDGVQYENIDTLEAYNTTSIHEYSLTLQKKYSYIQLYELTTNSQVIYLQTLFITPNHPISIYPNPAEDILYVNGITEPAPFQIINSTGAVVLEGILEPYTNILLENLITGTYLIQIQLSDTFFTQKILVQKR
ncbi:MAG: T9SS type A sorting domain-containing protein [Cytophagaceae bacterium]